MNWRREPQFNCERKKVQYYTIERAMALLTAVETSSAAYNLLVTLKAEDVDWTSEIYFDPKLQMKFYILPRIGFTDD